MCGILWRFSRHRHLHRHRDSDFFSLSFYLFSPVFLLFVLFAFCRGSAVTGISIDIGIVISFFLFLFLYIRLSSFCSFS